jgi:hypothetical protein
MPGSDALTDSTAVLALHRHRRTSGSSGAKTIKRRPSLLRTWQPTRTEERCSEMLSTGLREQKATVQETAVHRGNNPEVDLARVSMTKDWLGFEPYERRKTLHLKKLQ